ncbi:hypothetical protein JHK87_024163 [Glycine soja]|nr:hypothetical protein JHK87_024163 [Glycine soja]
MMMKSSYSSYLSILFLFFLLLVDKSLSKSGARFSLTRAVFMPHHPVIGGSQWDQTVETVEQQESAPQPTKQIKGLSKIKDYFSNFGYLLSSGGTFNDDLDQATVSAITTYQRFFNLKITGDLTNETLQQISLPRCGVPDINFDYDVSKDNVSWPMSRYHRRWFPDRNLTYGFSPASKIPSNATKAFRDAFARWAGSVPGLNLTETNYNSADLKVGFYNLDEGVEDVVWGESIIRLNASNVVSGEIRLDATKDWKLPGEKGENGTALDLESAAMHHIGHLLGLDHSNDEESVMYPYVLPSRRQKVKLSSSDKENIRLVYSKGHSGNGGSWGVVRIVTTLALGFAYYAVVLA